MSGHDSTDLIAAAVERALHDAADPRDDPAQALDSRAWQALTAIGLVGPDSATLSLRELAEVSRVVGHAGARVPFVDSEGLGRWLAAAAGIDTAADEILAVLMPPLGSVPAGDTAQPFPVVGLRVSYGGLARRVLLACEHHGQPQVGVIDAAALGLVAARNLADEPLDRCSAAAVTCRSLHAVGPAAAPAALWHRAALLRSAAMLGAMQRIHELTLQYAADRKQFGRALGQFQVIQSYLAEMAGEIAATAALLQWCLIARDAPDAPDAPDAAEVPAVPDVHDRRQRTSHACPDGGDGADADDYADIAALRIRAGRAAERVAALGHQVHGAMGFTREYPLHRFTRRLWAWREEYGNDTQWRESLGRTMVGLGGERWRARITG